MPSFRMPSTQLLPCLQARHSGVDGVPQMTKAINLHEDEFSLGRSRALGQMMTRLEWFFRTEGTTCCSSQALQAIATCCWLEAPCSCAASFRVEPALRRLSAPQSARPQTRCRASPRWPRLPASARLVGSARACMQRAPLLLLTERFGATARRWLRRHVFGYADAVIASAVVRQLLLRGAITIPYHTIYGGFIAICGTSSKDP
eukprot:2633381-Pleurochrysis_carterae.AAC.6